MISKLKGKVDERGKDSATIDVNGVGYLVRASARTLAAIGGEGRRAPSMSKPSCARTRSSCSASRRARNAIASVC